MSRPLTNIAAYSDIRASIKTGDIVFFDAAAGFISWVIGVATGRPPTHGAIVMRTYGDRVVLMESTLMLAGKRGVQRTYLSERVPAYDGRIWIAHLSPDIRRQIDPAKLEAWLLDQEGKRYDMVGAIYAGLDQIFKWLPESTYSRAFFCTRLCMAGLRNAGLSVEHEYSPTPWQLSQTRLFWKFSQIKGTYQQL